MPYWVAFCKKWIYRFGSLQDESLCTVWQTDLRIVYANTFFFFFAKSNACLCRFQFLFLFLSGVQYCLLSVQRREAFSLCPLQHTGRGSENHQRWDWEYLFNEYGGNWWCWDICQREKFKYMHIILCHRNLYYDAFFLNSILCRCFIHELFLQKLCGFLFHFPQLNMLWFHFFS